MTELPDHLNATSLKAVLARHSFVTEIIYRPRLGSTNDVAKARASEGAPEGLLVVTDEQTAGRGRMGRRWWAPAGSALLTSLLFRPTMQLGQHRRLPRARTAATGPYVAQQLMMLCALAAADAITDLSGLTVELKWPNDLIVQGRKLAGLLSESVFIGSRIDSVVVGAGINVNADLSYAPPFIAKATSLLEMGRPVNRLSLLVAYLDRVAHRYTLFRACKSPFDEWANRLVTIGQEVTARLGVIGSLHQESHVCELSGVAQGVGADGALLLRAADGTVHRLLAADVSMQEGDLTSPGPSCAGAPIQPPERTDNE